MIKALRKNRRVNAAYRSIFLDENGRLKPEAETVMKDLAEFARFFKNVPADPLALAVVEGSRQVLRHMLERLRATDQEFDRQLRRAAAESDD